MIAMTGMVRWVLKRSIHTHSVCYQPFWRFFPSYAKIQLDLSDLFAYKELEWLN